ncbi:ATP-binding protein [Actinacidiphila sp. DG2A-62]|jgi:anti-sigma regulatory factor (Ser/Thr protein kinase)|uniref:ATP-binding protein n=1 Tax=Actinacidiphila sp. DG2A-62 TaxID=3108821 RepID=UPI002DBDE3A2|nr:ATP-binding protein [Actinacidiphila sp. DG2A-62]MEC3996573.1 ATP-binding protein [Actinacidiphila sp. DG2A-62]
MAATSAVSAGNQPALTGAWPQAAASVGRARRALRTVMSDWALRELADEAELVLSELMTNAVQHARNPAGTVETRFSLLPGGDGVRLDVYDADRERWPRMRPATADDFGGRGLHLVDELTRRRWGVHLRPDAPGKTVWAEVSR